MSFTVEGARGTDDFIRYLDKCRGSPSPGAPLLTSVLGVGGFNCCEIKMVSGGIAALLNEFVQNPLMRDLLVTLSCVYLAF